MFDGDDNAVDNREQGWATCQMSGLNGLRLVAILERVQGGLLGETLSSFGITGLYITGASAGLSIWLLRQHALWADSCHMQLSLICTCMRHPGRHAPNQKRSWH